MKPSVDLAICTDQLRIQDLKIFVDLQVDVKSTRNAIFARLSHLEFKNGTRLLPKQVEVCKGKV
jgi:hypothetical protein